MRQSKKKIDFKKFSPSSLDDINDLNFATLGKNYKKLKWDEIDYSQLNETSIDEIDWTKINPELASHSETFSLDTIDWNDNFDDTLKEPSVLPSRLPNLLLNGTTGIAVGMATNMPPHNLTEIVNGVIAYIQNKGEIEISQLMEHVKAPDFPTGGTIYGYDGVKSAFETGRGRIVVRGKVRFEEDNGRERIIVEEIPYMVNKSNLIKQTADLVNSKKLDGISDIRDESDRNGMRIVYDLKRDCIPNIVLNKLFKFTSLQSSFSVNNICLLYTSDAADE